MVVNFATRVLGTERKVSKQGNEYDVMVFMDGVDVVRAMVDRNCDVSDLPAFENVILTLDIKTGKFSNVKVMSWEN